ncbi:MAG: hypothetical protein N2C14_13835 [Planctomycetales bacterium]
MSTPRITTDELLALSNYPISCIKQAAWKSIIASPAANKLNLWGRQTPVIAIGFEDEANSCLFVAASDTSLWFHVSRADDFDAVIDLVQRIDEEERDFDELVGFFDLDSMVCPVPDWDQLVISKASVVTANDDNAVLGICFWVNFGVRIGLFVAPNPGVALSFNDHCDWILAQAEKEEEAGYVRIVTSDFSDTKTTKQLDEIDWFDWLHK